MQRALLFPGQGSQKVGMGRACAEAFREARDVFAEIDDALNEKLSQIIFEGPEEDLKLTQNTQPALMAVSLAVWRVLEKQSGKSMADLASCVAGHSLGEYSALCAAGALNLSDTARLLRQRGTAMQKAVPVGVGSMAALIGVEMEEAKEITQLAATQEEVCTAANDNAPGQVVISGHNAAVDRAIALAAERGYKRSVKLPVSAPFHCPLMEPAALVMKEALGAVTINAPQVPIYANVLAAPVTDPALIRAKLVEQVTGSVRWRETILAMKEAGVSSFVECGAGNVLTGLMRRIDRSLEAKALQTPEDIEAFLS